MLLLGLGLSCSSVLVWFWQQTAVCARTSQPQILKVRGLTIVDEDEKGTPRAILGAPLPDQKQDKRPIPVSGLLSFDAAGNERGISHWHGEKSEAFLILDNAVGDGQAVMLLTNHGKSVTFVLTNEEGDLIGMTTALPWPTIQLVEREKVIFIQLADLPDVH